MDRTDVRIYVEGTEEAARGFRLLSIAVIPWLIIAALLGMVALYGALHATRHEVHQIGRAESAEQRADNRVGVKEGLKAPMTLSTRDGACIRFDSSYLEGSEVVAYIHNACHRHLNYYQIHVSSISPDGTVIQSNYFNTSSLPELDPGERGEAHVRPGGYGNDIDARAVRIRVYADRDQE